MATRSKTKETTTVTSTGNSQYAHLAGEGPQTDETPEIDGESIAQQEAEPTVLSHDLKNEGMPDEHDQN